MSTYPELPHDIEVGFRAMSAAAIMLHDTVGARLNLNATDHKCMGLLCNHGSLSAGALAEMTGLTTGAVTGVINRLEKAHYVRRTPNPADARSIIVQPTNTDDFLRKMDALLGPLRARMNALVNRYSKKDLCLVLRFMTEATEISRQETVRLAEAAALGRRFGVGDWMSQGPTQNRRAGLSKRMRGTAQSRSGKSSQRGNRP
jgi:DNA-binding MarR family transcriptional regulator